MKERLQAQHPVSSRNQVGKTANNVGTLAAELTLVYVNAISKASMQASIRSAVPMAGEKLSTYWTQDVSTQTAVELCCHLLAFWCGALPMFMCACARVLLASTS